MVGLATLVPFVSRGAKFTSWGTSIGDKAQTVTQWPASLAYHHLI